MIIVEGPDGGGKTTLIKELSEALELPIADRVVSSDAEPMVDLKKWVELNLDMGWQPMLFDRHRLISEPIYSSCLRKPLEPGFDDLGWFHHQMTQFVKIEPTIIYCLPSLRTVKANVRGQAENQRIEPVIDWVWEAYAAKALADFQNSRRVYIYDYKLGFKAAKSMMMRNILAEMRSHA